MENIHKWQLMRRLHLQKWKEQEDGAGKVKEFTLTVCRIPFKFSGASISGSVLIENGWDEIELYIAELRKLLSSKSCPRLASLCGLVVGKDDEQDVGQLHLQHPLRG